MQINAEECKKPAVSHIHYRTNFKAGIEMSWKVLKTNCRLYFCLFMLFAASEGFAQDLPVDPVGARHIALGGAAAALSYGADAVYHNPASLVWQTLTFGGGVQPIQWNKAPRSWWLAFYNQNSDYDVPVSLIAQGWWDPTDNGDRYVNMIGMPLAFNFTPATPGAATVKFAAERDENGDMTYGFPFDFGFLGRYSSSIVLGLVLRNVTIGHNPFDALEERLDYGVAYGGGPFTILASTTLKRKNTLLDSKEQYRLGIEAFSSDQIAFRAGFMQEPDQRFYTGGIGLRSSGQRQYEFSYAFVYDPEGKHFRHYIQYIFLLI